MLDPIFHSDPNDLHRLPGLFRRWELADVLAPGRSFCIERSGAAESEPVAGDLFGSAA